MFTPTKVMEKAVRQASPFGMKHRESVVAISLISSSNRPTIEWNDVPVPCPFSGDPVTL